MSKQFHPRKLIIFLFWIAIWQFASMAIDNNIVLVGPGDVVRSFVDLLPTADFWKAIGWSFGRISLGFLLAFGAGLLLGSLAFRFPGLLEFLEPAVLLMKSVPVASFVILALIWIGSRNLAIFISFLVVFPILYINTISGLKSTDQKLLEMARVFRLSPVGRIRHIYLPALVPYLVSGCKVALGMSWKSGIAAEVIGIPTHTIGENLYMAKIYLNTAELFAWTIVIILVSALFERTFLLLLQTFLKLWDRPLNPRVVPAVRTEKNSPAPFRLNLQNLSKSYDGRSIWKDLTLSLQSGHTYCLMGQSGSGKTTLFRILLELEEPDGGSCRCVPAPKHPLTAVFQENRLCETRSALDNILLATGNTISRQEAFHELCCLLPVESVLRPVSTLSGGMKRRVAIARAMLTPSCGILMDEPFTGLDEETRRRVISYIRSRIGSRLLLVATHQEEDVELLSGTLLKLF